MYRRNRAIAEGKRYSSSILVHRIKPTPARLRNSVECWQSRLEPFSANPHFTHRIGPKRVDQLPPVASLQHQKVSLQSHLKPTGIRKSESACSVYCTGNQSLLRCQAI